ncbi:16359_t:CDS:2, partial [Acaulospora colombiana]
EQDPELDCIPQQRLQEKKIVQRIKHIPMKCPRWVQKIKHDKWDRCKLALPPQANSFKFPQRNGEVVKARADDTDERLKQR